jgi:hypothetical protein
MIVIYRPPLSKTNKLSSSILFEEFCIFVEQLIILPVNILMAGDFNFHIDNIGDSDTIKLNKIYWNRLIYNSTSMGQPTRKATP